MKTKNFSLKPLHLTFRVSLVVILISVFSTVAQARALGQATNETIHYDLAKVEILAPNEPQNTHRILRFPANALNYDKASTILTQAATGIRWQSDFQNAAFLIVPRPADWDGVSDVTLHLFFLPTTNTSGNVHFFIRPRAFDPGDIFADASSLSGDPVAVSQTNQVREQTITIPAARFGNKAQWVITIQREGALETYTDDIILTSVGLSYSSPRLYLPMIIK